MAMKKGSPFAPFTWGPEFTVCPSMQIPPSRQAARCPLCGGPVNLHENHAVVVERYEGTVVAGAYAHVACCEGMV